MPLHVGILNITPDSFSDGGRYFDPRDALEQAERLLTSGASVIDVGAESTRPGAIPVSPEEEWKRLEPVLKPLRGLLKNALLSVDTRHWETASRSVREGADWINDVSGFSDPKMCELVAASRAECVVVHSLGVPADRNQVIPEDQDPMDLLLSWGERKIRELEGFGIASSRIILDPGIGFGKTPAQSVRILENLERLRTFGCRLLVGYSRKLSKDLSDAWRGADYLRVHQIPANLVAAQSSR